MEYKTSEEWQKLCKVKVYDPDGWDRTNFSFSWYIKKITRKEFEQKLINSSCMYPTNGDGNLLVDNIWKDKGV